MYIVDLRPRHVLPVTISYLYSFRFADKQIYQHVSSGKQGRDSENESHISEYV